MSLSPEACETKMSGLARAIVAFFGLGAGAHPHQPKLATNPQQDYILSRLCFGHVKSSVASLSWHLLVFPSFSVGPRALRLWNYCLPILGRMCAVHDIFSLVLLKNLNLGVDDSGTGEGGDRDKHQVIGDFRFAIDD